MGCGVSHFEQKEPEIFMDSEQNPNNNNLHDQETKAILPLLSNSYYNFNYNLDNDDDDEVDDDGYDEYRSQSSLEEEVDYYDLNRELHNTNSLKFAGSPSFREYCGFNHHHQYSQGLIEGANDDNRRFVEEPSDHMEKEEGSISKDKISVVVKKKVSRVRRIQSAISRTVLPTKFLYITKYNKTQTKI
ncbi:hypothetical protein CsatB_021201 [Cannabis sativa]